MAYDVAVVGLGAMGAAALYHLARGGHRVVGIEGASPGHEGGSSHGESRIIRRAQFENPAYTPLVDRAYDLWRALGEEGGADVIVDTGILEAGPSGAPVVDGSLAAARLHGLPHEILTPEESRRRFPAFDLPEDWTIVFQPGAGIVRADRAMRFHVEGALRAGAEVRERSVVTGLEQDGSGVRVKLEGGEEILAGSAIIACGPWLGGLVPRLRAHLAITRQVVCWFEPKRPADVTPERMPVFITEDAADAVYGFPDFAGAGVKAASHRLGRRLHHALDAAQDAGPDDTQTIAAALARMVPVAAGRLIAAKVCLYTNTPDEEFVIDHHPDLPGVVFCSACSGHGFKFASVFGEILAGMALGEAPPAVFDQFRLSRFGA
jgi:sarcosine oxidase